MPPAAPSSPAALIARLEGAKSRFGRADGAAKRAALAALARLPIRGARLLGRFHEALVFLRAHPDDPALLRAVEAALDGFAARVAALARPESLDETGIAGTVVCCPLSYAAARWLTTRFPEAVEIDWEDADSDAAVGALVTFLSGLAAEEALVEVSVPYREWLAAAGGRGRRGGLDALLDGLAGGSRVAAARQALYDALGLRVRWDLRDGPASRTRLALPGSRVFFHRGALRRWRGPLARRLPGAPVPVRRAPAPEALALLDAARAAVVVRYREVHAFNFADPADVLVADLGRGVRVAWFGVLPAHRLPLRAHYGYLLLKNGVPAGYGDASFLFDRVEIAYNVFETFRQGESAFMFVRLLAFLHQRFGVRAFLLDPYQIGHQNDEALDSGAFWFYDKLGFRPRRPDIARLAAAERRRIRTEPGYRSSRETLIRLGESGMAAAVGRGGASAASLDVRRLGLRAVAAARAGPGGAGRVAAGVARALDRIRWRAWSRPEREAFERLAPILALIPDLAAWPARERRTLVDAIRAKGRPGEADYLRRLTAHRRLRRHLLALAGSAGPAQGA